MHDKGLHMTLTHKLPCAQDLAQLRAQGLHEAQAARDAAHLAEAMAASLKQKHQLQEAFRDAAGGCSAASTLDAHLERLR